MKKCEYGCDEEAKFFFKSGKVCCSKFTSMCSGMKKKNSIGVKLARKGKGNSYWPSGHPKGSKAGTSLKGKTYEEIYGEDGAARKKQKTAKTLSMLPNSWEMMSKEQKDLHRERARKNILKRYEDGWLPKAGRCKKYIYESPIAGKIRVDGTWELAVAEWLDQNTTNWKRNTKRFEYFDNNKRRYYTPDFWIEDWSSYLEVKGYETMLDRCKWSQFTDSLIVWKRTELEERNII